MFLIGSLDKSFLIEEVPGETGVLGGTVVGLDVDADTGADDDDTADIARFLSLGFLPGFGRGGKTQCLLVLITKPLREPLCRLLACSVPNPLLLLSLGAI